LKVFISAANGRTGRHVIEALQHRPEKPEIVAFCRGLKPSIPDVHAAIGDMLDPSALDRALAGVDAVIHYGPSLNSMETAMGIAVIDAAVRMSVKRFIFISVIHPMIDDLLNHKAKLIIEAYLVNSGLDWSILRPQHYSQNIDVARIVADGFLEMPYPVTTTLGHVDMADLAEAAAKIALEPGHSYATYDIACDDHLSVTQICETIATIANRPIEAREITVGQWIDRVSRFRSFNIYEKEACWRLFGYYGRNGIFANSNVLRWLLGRPATTFEEYVRGKFERSRI
jgi:uncharacterized protein YbjT (DUF2867 family)